MTRKHFQQLATIAAEVLAANDKARQDNTPPTGAADLRFTNALANFCAEQNPRFDRARWHDAVSDRRGL